MGLAHTFYYSPVAETREQFASLFQRLYPAEQLHTAASWEELNSVLTKHSFLCYLVSIPQQDPQLKELLFDIRTICPSGKIIVTCAPGVSGELESIVERLTIESVLTEPLTAEQFAAAYDGIGSGEMSSFAGRIRLSLPEIIQLFCHGRRDTALQVKTMTDEGKIYFERGEIVHCRTNALRGLEAIFAMLAWQSGRFLEFPTEQATEHSIDMRWENILMESAQHLDEVSSVESPDFHGTPVDEGDFPVAMTA
jgi:hypothetical protein